ncbi:MAG: hypothetical protein PW843_20490 [Azospirillaceae bacterium]|nr:hypothetical protein [Azospirillaceae bacterium]
MKKDNQILQDVPAFNAVGLGLVFGLSELAVYAGANVLIPTLDLKIDVAILAWGASLMLLGPSLGLAAMYGLHQAATGHRPGKPSGFGLAPVPPSRPGSDGKPDGTPPQGRRPNWFPYDPDTIGLFDLDSPYPALQKAPPERERRPLEAM